MAKSDKYDGEPIISDITITELTVNSDDLGEECVKIPFKRD